jgi:hypothetical protein
MDTHENMDTEALTIGSEAKTYGCPKLLDTPAKPLLPAAK